MKSRLLLIFGPSGSGKSVLISELLKMDQRFIYISPFITRPLRDNEFDKIMVSNQELDEMLARKDLLVVNEIYGVRYGTPRAPIELALQKRCFPLIDWPIDRACVMEEFFPNNIFGVYLVPPDLNTLFNRLRNRNNNYMRFAQAKDELEKINSGKYNKFIKLKLVSKEKQQKQIARVVYDEYLRALS